MSEAAKSAEAKRKGKGRAGATESLLNIHCLTRASAFTQTMIPLEEARRLSCAYNAPRKEGANEDTVVALLKELLDFIDRNNFSASFLEEVAEKISGIDGADYIMLPALQRLSEQINNTNQSIDVFLYVLLCPMGRCAGVSGDTNTGAYFEVIEEAVENGKIMHLFIFIQPFRRNCQRRNKRSL